MNQKAYVRQIVKRLHCSGKRKNEIKKQIESDIASYLSEGEDMNQIISHMGNVREVAAAFNENFSDKEVKAAKMRKVTKIIAIIAVVFLVIGAGIYFFIPKIREVSASKVFTEEQLNQHADEIISLMDQDKYETIISEHCSLALQKVLNKQQLESAKEKLDLSGKKSSGIISSVVKEIDQAGVKYGYYEGLVSYDNKNISYILSFDKQYKLKGFYIR